MPTVEEAKAELYEILKPASEYVVPQQTAAWQAIQAMEKLIDAKIAAAGAGANAKTGSLDELRRKQVLAVMEQTGWHQGKASKVLGISLSTLYRELKALGLTRSHKTGATE